MKNKVEIQVDKVIKTFGSRMDFVRESSIYEKIQGKGLAPELTGIWDGVIGHEYIKGESFNDVVHRSMDNPVEFIKYSNIFFDWYKKFRDIVNISLGDMDFSDFILNEDGLFCVDFEHCKPGSIEDDVANLAANVCLMGDSYTRFGMEDAKIFVKSAWERVEMSSEKLYQSLNKRLESVCVDKGIAPMMSANEYLATFVCCSFIHAPKRRIVLTKMLEDLRKSHQCWTLFAEDITGEAEQNIRYLLSSTKESCNAIFLTENGNAQLFPLLLKTEDAISILTTAADSKMNLTDAIVEKFSSKGMAVENMK